MKLPFAENAVISEKKIKDYLLSHNHPVGKLKAKFFASMGFSLKDFDKLRKLLLQIAINEDVINMIPSEYGEKYIIEGTINSPRHKSVRLQTVWIIDTGKKQPRFV